MKAKMRKKCELCRGSARMYCESDQASLCWSCDFQVHAANFLVARHLRTLLCHVCQSPTPWTATGTKLGPTVSVCDNCCLRKRNRLDDGEEEADVNESEGEDVGEQDDDDYDEKKDNEDFQVVPWSPTAPPPPASSSSNNDEETSNSSSSASSSLASSPRDRKRMRKNASDPHSQENRCWIDLNKPPEMAAKEVACACGGGGERADCVDSLSTRCLKRRRRESGRIGISRPNSRAIVESVKLLQRQEMGSPAAIAKLCRLSEDQSAVDCDSSKCA
ncbi:uncharacterized protein [Coffea arabica]|uniref:B box-type domain-containing protein n=1 Tax=Coffea arabica TaxID=13443 RepID=A0A6P6SAZ4_COFAR|nr:zinc finger protein CO3-like [Coffea arabica]